MFSGGTYEEVARWLLNFLTSHGKREDPRAEVELNAGDARDGESYAARFRLGEGMSDALELAYREVAEKRGSLAWCQGLADRARSLVAQLKTPAGAGARAR